MPIFNLLLQKILNMLHRKQLNMKEKIYSGVVRKIRHVTAVVVLIMKLKIAQKEEDPKAIVNIRNNTKSMVNCGIVFVLHNTANLKGHMQMQLNVMLPTIGTEGRKSKTKRV